MSPVASFAVGSLLEHSDSRPLLWGLWDALDHAGYRVQSYHARAAYDPCPAATAITGLCPQHLDSWLMNRTTLEKIYQRSAAQSDVAVIHGPLSSSNINPPRKQGTPDVEPWTVPPSRIETIAETLNLPLLAQVDIRPLQSCLLPARPENCVGLLLDHVPDRRTWATWKTILESEWQLPVLGAITACPELRAAASKPTCPRDVYRHLGNEFRRFTSLSELVTTLRTRKNVIEQGISVFGYSYRRAEGLRIAFAYDEVFCCGFRGVLDEFESQGAELLDFSPLHDEALPHDVDLVYLGCAPVERYADALLANTCMVAALREHVCGGRRIYGEVGGAAYLCRELVLPDGTVFPMLGILPASAVLNDAASSPEPREVSLRTGSWLGSEGETLRGYHSCRWQLVPSEHALTLGQDAELVMRHHAIGSTLQLFPAASEELLGKFLTPCPAALSWAVSG